LLFSFLGVTVLQLDAVVRAGVVFSSVAAISWSAATARAQDEIPASDAATQSPDATAPKPNLETEPKSPKNNPVPAEAPAKPSPEVEPAKPKSSPRMPRKKGASSKAKAINDEASPSSSPFFPNWAPAGFGINVRPVLGVDYLLNPSTGNYLLQGEMGVFLGLRGIPLVPGNPGMQIEPGFGYAVGQAAVKESGKSIESGVYRRRWGSVRTPIYYRFVRQTFEGKYGEVGGGPLPISKRASFQSDTGVLILSNLSGHYTLTYERAWGEEQKYPEITSYDHWVHARIAASVLNFYIDAGPGYSTSKSVLNTVIGGAAGKAEGTSSGAYLLALSGFDLLGDRLGFDASAKYMFSSNTDLSFYGVFARSPLEDLGAQSALVGLPADSLNASAFFGFRRLFGGFGLGWRYTLQILNYGEKNGTKQQKTESNGIGITGNFSF
jgi:hypothetical protein